MPLGSCPYRGGVRGLACFAATCAYRQYARPSITPTTTAGANQVATPSSTHHHRLIPTPNGTSPTRTRAVPSIHHTTSHASPLRPGPAVASPPHTLTPRPVPHRPASRHVAIHGSWPVTRPPAARAGWRTVARHPARRAKAASPKMAVLAPRGRRYVCREGSCPARRRAPTGEHLRARR
jgi:hypothetical protein